MNVKVNNYLALFALPAVIVGIFLIPVGILIWLISSINPSARQFFDQLIPMNVLLWFLGIFIVYSLVIFLISKYRNK